MESLKTGQFFGQTNETIHLNGLTLTDTEYTHERVDWHYHENAYFTFILDGKVIEGNKKEVYQCTPGSLLFHNWQESHYNIKPPGYTRGFHVELGQDWFKSYDLMRSLVQGSISIGDPSVRIQMFNIVKETKLYGNNVNLAIDALLLALFARLNHNQALVSSKTPSWALRIREILHDTSIESWSLHTLAQTLDIHPVHLSRDFPRHFQCNLGEYIRRIKMQRALSLIPAKDFSLTEIAMSCGFSDQSHFIRCFRSFTGLTPLQYKRLLYP